MPGVLVVGGMTILVLAAFFLSNPLQHDVWTFDEWVSRGAHESEWYGKGEHCGLKREFHEGRRTITINCVPWRGVRALTKESL